LRYNSIICGGFTDSGAVFGMSGSNIGYTIDTVSVEIEGSVDADFTVDSGSLKVNCATRGGSHQEPGNVERWHVNNHLVVINQAISGKGVVGSCLSGTACTSIPTDVSNFSSALCSLSQTPGNGAGLKPSTLNTYDFNIYEAGNYGVAVVNVSADQTFFGSAIGTIEISANATSLTLIILNIVSIQ
jgi:hypothetical protein